jgi:multidrug efflux system outer membrane protein
VRRWIGAALLGLAACATVGPDYQRPAVELPAQFADQAGAPAPPPIAPQWWNLYSDKVLDGLVAESQRRNADLRLAAARVQEAEGALREARAALWPDVMLGYTASRSRVSASGVPAPPPGTITRPSHQILASTSFETDFWGRFARATEAAQAGLLASRLGQDVVGITLAGTTAQAYFTLRSLDAQIAVLDSSIRLRRDSLAIAQARLQAGLSSELDVHQAQGALADALVQRRDAGRGRALVEHQLGQLTGRLDLKLVPADLFALPLPPVPPAGLPSSLLERRPDIRAAEESLIAANAQIGVARAALFPTLTLTASAGAQSAELSTLLSSGSAVWAIGAGIAAPIFDAGRREARVEQAQARREQALANYQRSIESGFREVSDALVNVQQTNEAEADLMTRLQAARNALQLSTLRYETGYSPYLEVLDAQRTANDAELAFVRNRQARLAFSVDLMKSLGGGWSPRSSGR